MSLLEVLGLGLLLGVRHAFDADHLVAVSTIVSEYRNPLRAIWVGASWGLGHTSTLILAGLLLLLFQVRISEYMAQLFEFVVGGMLVLLGLQTIWSVRRKRVHLHQHEHPRVHSHFHSHESTEDHVHHDASPVGSMPEALAAGLRPDHLASARAEPSALKPFFRVKSYVVGTVHGLAGSAALMLLVLASVRSAWDGIWYMVVFGAGTLVSMAVVSVFISLPFSASSRLPRVNQVVRVVAGAFSIAFGGVLMYEVGVVGGLL